VTEEAPQPARAFAQFLLEQRRGALHEELSEQLAEVVSATLEHIKTGSISITFTVKPSGDGMVQIADEVKVKVPTGDKPPSMFFVDGRGGVHRQNPHQMEMPLSAVEERERGTGA
jgi:hypothetical protein